MKAGTAVIATIVGLLVIVALAIGGWQLGWWLKSETVNRNTAIANDSLARQQALRDKAIQDYTTLAKIDVQITQAASPQLTAQRQAIVVSFCTAYRQLTGSINIDKAIQDFALKECA